VEREGVTMDSWRESEGERRVGGNRVEYIDREREGEEGDRQRRGREGECVCMFGG